MKQKKKSPKGKNVIYWLRKLPEEYYWAARSLGSIKTYYTKCDSLTEAIELLPAFELAKHQALILAALKEYAKHLI